MRALFLFTAATAACGHDSSAFDDRNEGLYEVAVYDVGPCGGGLAPAYDPFFPYFRLTRVGERAPALELNACQSATSCEAAVDSELQFSLGPAGPLVADCSDDPGQPGGTTTCRQVVAREVTGGVQYDVYESNYPGCLDRCPTQARATSCIQHRLVGKHLSYD